MVFDGENLVLELDLVGVAERSISVTRRRPGGRRGNGNLKRMGGDGINGVRVCRFAAQDFLRFYNLALQRMGNAKSGPNPARHASPAQDFRSRSGRAIQAGLPMPSNSRSGQARIRKTYFPLISRCYHVPLVGRCLLGWPFLLVRSFLVR
jgi:hypothetical protein